MKKLNSFLHSAIRWILGIGWEKMKEERIANEEVRERFNNIPPAEDFIGKRILRFLRKTIRTSDNKKKRRCSMHKSPSHEKVELPRKCSGTQSLRH